MQLIEYNCNTKAAYICCCECGPAASRCDTMTCTRAVLVFVHNVTQLCYCYQNKSWYLTAWVELEAYLIVYSAHVALFTALSRSFCCGFAARRSNLCTDHRHSKPDGPSLPS